MKIRILVVVLLSLILGCGKKGETQNYKVISKESVNISGNVNVPDDSTSAKCSGVMEVGPIEIGTLGPGESRTIEIGITQETKHCYVGTEEEVEEGDWVLGRWERRNNLEWCGAVTSWGDSDPSYHIFIINDSKISACPNCGNRPLLNRYIYSQIEYPHGWKIYCDMCGSLETTIGKDLDAVKAYWEVLVKKEKLK